ncbi:MAG: hypothetical protein J6U14_10070 [Bacteroidaceae bacterium]|nr:hypothetical protein [Bacteroidaceae bacterium]
MKKLFLFLISMIALSLPITADDVVKEGEQVRLTEDCYGTVVPETLDKLVEYSRNDNFDMFSTFFKFGYAIFLDKDTPATVIKTQQNKVQLRFPNHTQFWVYSNMVAHGNQ